MKYCVIVNPQSHGGRAGKNWHAIEPLLPEAVFHVTADMPEARRLAAETDCDAVVACGGDGTINAIADGVLASANPDLKFGVLYMGTSPDFCAFHHMPLDLGKAVGVLKAGVTKRVPVLQANGQSFFCSCNLGMGAEVASAANRLRPWLGDKPGTLLALLKSLLRSRKYDFALNDECLPQCNHLLITRMPYIASGLKIALPRLAEDEYAVWYVQKLSLGKWLALLPKFYRGIPCGTVRVCRGELQIQAEAHVPYEFDGDPHGALPLQIRFSERQLNLIVPETDHV